MADLEQEGLKFHPNLVERHLNFYYKAKFAMSWRVYCACVMWLHKHNILCVNIYCCIYIYIYCIYAMSWGVYCAWVVWLLMMNKYQCPAPKTSLRALIVHQQTLTRRDPSIPPGFYNLCSTQLCKNCHCENFPFKPFGRNILKINQALFPWAPDATTAQPRTRRILHEDKVAPFFPMVHKTCLPFIAGLLRALCGPLYFMPVS